MALDNGLGSWQQLVGLLQCLAAGDKVLCCLQNCSARLVGWKAGVWGLQMVGTEVAWGEGES